MTNIASNVVNLHGSKDMNTHDVQANQTCGAWEVKYESRGTAEDYLLAAWPNSDHAVYSATVYYSNPCNTSFLRPDGQMPTSRRRLKVGYSHTPKRARKKAFKAIRSDLFDAACITGNKDFILRHFQKDLRKSESLITYHTTTAGTLESVTAEWRQHEKWAADNTRRAAALRIKIKDIKNDVPGAMKTGLKPLNLESCGN